MKSIIVPILLYNTTLGAMKYIDTMSPKAYELLGNLVSWQTITYHQSLHNHLDQIIIPNSSIILSKEMRIGIFTQFCIT